MTAPEPRSAVVRLRQGASERLQAMLAAPGPQPSPYPQPLFGARAEEPGPDPDPAPSQTENPQED